MYTYRFFQCHMLRDVNCTYLNGAMQEWLEIWVLPLVIMMKYHRCSIIHRMMKLSYTKVVLTSQYSTVTLTLLLCKNLVSSPGSLWKTEGARLGMRLWTIIITQAYYNFDSCTCAGCMQQSTMAWLCACVWLCKLLVETNYCYCYFGKSLHDGVIIAMYSKCMHTPILCIHCHIVIRINMLE